MASVTKSIVVRRPASEVAAIVSDPESVMAVLARTGRTSRVPDTPHGDEQWTVFIVLGTMYVGGKVRIDEAGDGVLAWHAISGFRHKARFVTAGAPVGEPGIDGPPTLLSVHFEYFIGGAVTGYLTARLVRGYVERTADAVLEGLRHRIEFGPTAH